jgi:hypothetical protein
MEAMRGDAGYEKEWLEGEVRMAANLSDQDRIRILRDLLETSESIRRSKTVEELERDEEVRAALDGEGLRRYRALVERLE